MRKQLEAEGKIEPVEKREGLDGKEYEKSGAKFSHLNDVETESSSEPDPYSEWLDAYVLHGDRNGVKGIAYLPSFRTDKFKLLFFS